MLFRSAVFAQLLADSPSIREAIEQMAQARAEENIAARQREGAA